MHAITSRWDCRGLPSTNRIFDERPRLSLGTRGRFINEISGYLSFRYYRRLYIRPRSTNARAARPRIVNEISCYSLVPAIRDLREPRASRGAVRPSTAESLSLLSNKFHPARSCVYLPGISDISPRRVRGKRERRPAAAFAPVIPVSISTGRLKHLSNYPPLVSRVTRHRRN